MKSGNNFLCIHNIIFIYISVKHFTTINKNKGLWISFNMQIPFSFWCSIIYNDKSSTGMIWYIDRGEGWYVKITVRWRRSSAAPGDWHCPTWRCVQTPVSSSCHPPPRRKIRTERRSKSGRPAEDSRSQFPVCWYSGQERLLERISKNLEQASYFLIQLRNSSFFKWDKTKNSKKTFVQKFQKHLSFKLFCDRWG